MCCSCRCNCTLIGLAASVLLGVIAAFLAIAGTITVAVTFGWVTLGIAVVYLAVALVAVSCYGCGSDCKCAALRALIAGVLSMALASLVVLAVGLVATSVVSALLIGWLVASLALTLVSTACLVSDLAGCN